MHRSLFALVLLATVLPAHSAEVAGRASVIDGDTLDIHGTRIRLHGVDAPESAQTCQDEIGNDWRCGKVAALALSDRIGTAPVRCLERDKDRYGRSVAVCYLGEIDINGWLVESGWAIAYREYSTDYVGQEQAARDAKVGVWTGRFILPDRWRRGDRLDEPTASASQCNIKGNISRDGVRIYHVPNGRFYNATKIDLGAGERMFCTEDEARVAGWRKSQE